MDQCLNDCKIKKSYVVINNFQKQPIGNKVFCFNCVAPYESHYVIRINNSKQRFCIYCFCVWHHEGPHGLYLSISRLRSKPFYFIICLTILFNLLILIFGRQLCYESGVKFTAYPLIQLSLGLNLTKLGLYEMLNRTKQCSA